MNFLDATPLWFPRRLLFLVTEELLLEAHEAQEHHGGEEHIWWVDACFFGGFLAAFLLDKLL